MTLYYVSNAASNGYALGVDTNSGLSPTTPFLTWTKATNTMATGDTAYGNPSGIAYDENSGGTNSGLHVPGGINRAQTFQTDPSLLGVEKCIITAAASDRIVNVASSSGAITFNDIIFDGLGSTTKDGFEPNNQTGGLFLNRCQIQGLPSASHYAIRELSGSNNIFAGDKCVFHSSVANGQRIEGSGSFTHTGLTSSTTTNTFPLCVADSSTVTSLHIGASGDGTRSTFNGSGSVMDIRTGTITTLEVDHCDFGGTLAFGIIGNGSFPSTITNLLFHDNTISGTNWSDAAFRMYNVTSTNAKVYNNQLLNSNGSLCTLGSENINGIEIYNNTGTNTAATTIDMITVNNGSGTINIHDNILTNNSSSAIHTILVGADGYLAFVAPNNVTGTTTQNMGDVSGNTYIDEAFTSNALTMAGRCSFIGAISVTMKSQGAPSGNITCALYTDSAGVPGTLIEASETTVNVNLLTSSFQTVGFLFTGNPQLTASTKYHLVFTYSGSIDGTNYVIFSANTTVTNGNLSKSTTGPGGSWSADATHAILYTIFGVMQATIIAHSNNLSVALTANSQVHALICGGCTTPKLYQNQVYNCGPGLILKDCKGGSIYDNLLWTALGNQGPISLKATPGAFIYQNIVVANSSGATNCCYLTNDIGTANPFTSNATSKNNIFYNFGAATNTAIYFLDIGCSITSDYNDIYIKNAAIITLAHTTWASWQGSGQDAHGVNLDPLLANEINPSSASDFVPSANSPAKTSGINLNGAVPTDYLGNNFAIIPSAGAYSIPAYYANSGSNKLAFNIFTNNFDYLGLTQGAAAALYASIPSLAVITATSAIPSGYGNYTILVDTTAGAVTINLPPALGANASIYNIKKISSDANNVTIDGNGSEPIDGSATKVFNTQYTNFQIQAYGAGATWEIL